MARKYLVAASVAAAVVLGACARNDDAAYDSAAGATAGAMATPPASTYPSVGTSVGASTTVIDSLKIDSMKKDTTATKRP
jgi:hypothetical protein